MSLLARVGAGVAPGIGALRAAAQNTEPLIRPIGAAIGLTTVLAVGRGLSGRLLAVAGQRSRPGCPRPSS